MTADPTTPKGRAELRRRFANTTPGPWRIGWFDGPGQILIEAGPEDDPTWINHDPSGEDAELIVAAVNALPALLDALDDAYEQGRNSAVVQAEKWKARAKHAEAALDSIRDYAQFMRALADTTRDAGGDYLAHTYREIATALERKIGDRP